MLATSWCGSCGRIAKRGRRETGVRFFVPCFARACRTRRTYASERERFVWARHPFHIVRHMHVCILCDCRSFRLSLSFSPNHSFLMQALFRSTSYLQTWLKLRPFGASARPWQEVRAEDDLHLGTLYILSAGREPSFIASTTTPQTYTR